MDYIPKFGCVIAHVFQLPSSYVKYIDISFCLESQRYGFSHCIHFSYFHDLIFANKRDEYHTTWSTFSNVLYISFLTHLRVLGNRRNKFKGTMIIAFRWILPRPLWAIFGCSRNISALRDSQRCMLMLIYCVCLILNFVLIWTGKLVLWLQVHGIVFVGGLHPLVLHICVSSGTRSGVTENCNMSKRLVNFGCIMPCFHYRMSVFI